MAAGFTQKEWKDRITEFPTRRQLDVVSETDSGMTVDVSRAEGLVSQEGDAYSAANMNGLEQRIKASFDNVDNDVNGAKSSVTGLSGRMTAAENNISGLTTRMGTAETNISGLTSRMGAAEKNITKVSGDLTNNVNALNNQLATINVYVGSDGKLHFVNRAGADTVLPFSTTFAKIQGMAGAFNSDAHTNTFSTGVTGKTLWKTLFIVPMLIPASGSSNNNFYNGGGITYDPNTGIIVINASYRQVTADIYYIK